MARPIILADNRFSDNVLVASGTAAGFDVLHVRDGRTYTYWKGQASGTSYLMAYCGAPKSADTLAIIGHNLKSAAALVSVERSGDGVSWSTVIAPFTPASDKALVKRFVKRSAPYWRLKIETAEVIPFLAVVQIGTRIEFPYPPDAPFVPYVESSVEDSAVSKTGAPLGTVVRYVSVEIAPTFSVLDREWLETVYRPFREAHGRWRKYFFWAGDLDLYPEQVFFVKDAGKFEPPISTLAYYDALKLQLQGVMEL